MMEDNFKGIKFLDLRSQKEEEEEGNSVF